jgi:hypothetical protein
MLLNQGTEFLGDRGTQSIEAVKELSPEDKKNVAVWVPSPAPTSAGEVAERSEAGEGKYAIFSQFLFGSGVGANFQSLRVRQSETKRHYRALTGPGLRRGHLSRARGRRGRGHAGRNIVLVLGIQFLLISGRTSIHGASCNRTPVDCHRRIR